MTLLLILFFFGGRSDCVLVVRVQLQRDTQRSARLCYKLLCNMNSDSLPQLVSSSVTR